MNFCLRIILTLLTLMPALASVAKSVPLCITDGEKELSRMLNLREKTRLVVGAGYGPLLSGFNIPFCRGIVAGAAGQTNGNPRMGIRPLVLSDGPAGLRLKTTPGSSSPTSFPIGSLLACSWDTAYVRQAGEGKDRGMEGDFLLTETERRLMNVGERAGSTVVQLYGKREGMPTELLTFAKTSILMPGETRRLTLRLPAWLVPKGLSVSGFSYHL